MQLPEETSHDHGKILDHADGIGQVNRDEVERRARELAAIDGFTADQVNEGHRYRARQEMRGAPDADRANDEEFVGDLIERDDIAGESGSIVAEAPSAAMTGDEQTVGEELYSEGISEAEHDRMVASRRQERLDR